MIGWISLAVTILSGAAWLVLQAERMSELSLGQVFQQGAVWTVLSETDFGYAWMLRLVMAGLLAAMLPRLGPSRWSGSRRLSAAAIVVSAGLIGTLAWAGHGAAGSDIEGAVHLAADILHLIAAAAWGGALVPLALLLHAARRDPAEAFGGDRADGGVALFAPRYRERRHPGGDRRGQYLDAGGKHAGAYSARIMAVCCW